MINSIVRNTPTEVVLKKTIPFLVFSFGIWYFCLRILGTGLEYIPGDLGDARFINYLLEHGYNWLNGTNQSFWDAGFMYPYKNTVAISDNVLGTMPIYSVWRLFGFNQETSYQLWWISICSLNFWATYFIINKWFKRWDIALIAAWIFAFTIFNLGQLNYMQMTIRFMVPIVLYAAYKLVSVPSPKYFALYTLGIVYQFYCVIYTGFFLMYFSFAFLVVFAVISRNTGFFIVLLKKENILKTLLISAVAVSSMLWLISPYLKISEELGMRTFEDVKMFVPLWESYLFPQHSAYFWKILIEKFEPNYPYWWVHHTFPGMIPLLGLIASPFILLLSRLKKISLSKLSIALFITVILVGIFYIRTEDGKTLYKFLFKLPGMDSIRVVNRFMHVELMLIILALTTLAVKIPKKYTIIIFLLAILDNSFVGERVIRSEKQEITYRREKLIAEVLKEKEDKHIAFAFIDPNNQFFVNHLDAMIVSEYVGIPTVNGYSSACPGEFGEFFSNADQKGLSRWLNHNKVDSTKILLIEHRIKSPRQN